MLLELVIFFCFQSFRKDEGKHGLNDKSSSYNLGVAAYEHGDFTTARNYFELELNEANNAGGKHREGKAYTSLGNAFKCLGDHKKALEFHQQSLSIAKEIGDKDTQGKAYTNLGNALKCLGHYKKAIECHQQSLSIAKEIGNKDTEGKTYTNLGIAYKCFNERKGGARRQTILVNPYFKREFRLDFAFLLRANEVDIYPGTRLRSRGKKAKSGVKQQKYRGRYFLVFHPDFAFLAEFSVLYIHLYHNAHPVFNNKAPLNIFSFVTLVSDKHYYNTRFSQADTFAIQNSRTQQRIKSFSCTGLRRGIAFLLIFVHY